MSETNLRSTPNMAMTMSVRLILDTIGPALTSDFGLLDSGVFLVVLTHSSPVRVSKRPSR